jgi:hypothetical protein
MKEKRRTKRKIFLLGDERRVGVPTNINFFESAVDIHIQIGSAERKTSITAGQTDEETNRTNLKE